MTLRYVFSEMPYAMVLAVPHVDNRCSFCAGDASEENENKRVCSCRSVVYCSESCMQNDQPLHKNECMAFRLEATPGDTDSAYMGVRLMGRVLSRYRLDNGIVNLSSDFPSDELKDRCFDDLMSHERELRRCWAHEALFKETKTNFYRFFSGSPLASTPSTMFRKFFYRLCINGFTLSVRLQPPPHPREEIGESIYLNSSRFDHSCRSTCLYRFDGARIVIEYIDYATTEANPIRFNKKQFANLTLQYGFHSFWNYGITCPSTEQRRKTLKCRYFFKCQCVLCSDKTRNRIQLDAAPVECGTCKVPYVWERKKLLRSMRLKKLCGCKSTKGSELHQAKVASYDSRNVKELMKKWADAMRTVHESDDPRAALELCLPLLEMANKYWHPVRNLRRGQLSEMLFIKIHVASFEDDMFVGNKECLDFLLKCGESMLTIYCSYYEPYMISSVAGDAVKVANLYKLRDKSIEDVERSQYWYNFAIQVWNDRDATQQIEKQARAPPIKWQPPNA